MKTSVDSRNIELDALSAELDGGFLKIYTGDQPVTPETPASGTLLATLEFGSPAFGAASNGIVTSNPIVEDSDAAATGAAGWFRCFASDGVTAILDGTVGTSGADINLNSVAIQAHTSVTISAFSITLPQ